MRKFVYAAAAAILSLSATGCQNALADDYGPLTGTWKVTITDFKYWAPLPEYECDRETTWQVRQEGNEVEGVSTEAVMTCVNTTTGRIETHDMGPGVVRGPVENGHMEVSEAGGFLCIAELHPTRIEGVLESRGGVVGGPDFTLRSGTCVLEKISDEGYYGPRA